MAENSDQKQCQCSTPFYSVMTLVHEQLLLSWRITSLTCHIDFAVTFNRPKQLFFQEQRLVQLVIFIELSRDQLRVGQKQLEFFGVALRLGPWPRSNPPEFSDHGLSFRGNNKIDEQPPGIGVRRFGDQANLRRPSDRRLDADPTDGRLVLHQAAYLVP